MHGWSWSLIAMLGCSVLKASNVRHPSLVCAKPRDEECQQDRRGGCRKARITVVKKRKIVPQRIDAFSKSFAKIREIQRCK